jgi:hypothetical protein
MGKMKVRRQERVTLVSDSWIVGRVGEFAACEFEADSTSLRRTGEALMI